MIGRARQWFVHRANRPDELENVLNDLEKEGYEIFAVLDTSPTEGFLFLVIASKYVNRRSR